MRLSNGFVIDKEKTFGELKFTAVRDVFLQNEDGTPSTQLKMRIYELEAGNADFLLYLTDNTHGSVDGKRITLPIYSMNRFHF